MPNVLDIIVGFLKANGYDGLTRTDYACRCLVDSIAACGAVSAHCVPAYRWKCDGCSMGPGPDIEASLCEWDGHGCFRTIKQEGEA